MGRLVASVAAFTIATAGTLAAAGPASADGQGTTVMVHGNGTTVTLSRASVEQGRVRFKVDTSNRSVGSQITLFRLVSPATLATFTADLAEEFSQDPMTAAQGTRDLNRDVRIFGLADVVSGTPVTVTEQLPAGRYYVMDLGNGPSPTGPQFTTFTVRGTGHVHSVGQSGGPVVKLTSADRFISPHTLPARGTITVKNVSDTIHFMAISPVKKGTTDAQIQAYFDSAAQVPPPFFVNGPSVGMDVLSPGLQLQLTYRLPPGTYVLMCFIADDVTGMPHAIMGMHKVVILK
ncbi:MAG: hypothetical protein ABI662_01185 [Dermatophilaceae bacterium]